MTPTRRHAPALAALLAAAALAACGNGAEDGNGADTPAASEPAAEGVTGTLMETGTYSEDGMLGAYGYNASDAVRRGETESGIEYVVINDGEEGASGPASERDRVTVHYEGRLARTGEVFDSSYERGQTASFPLNGVIPGWTEGLQLMEEGETFLFHLPARLAYGDNPRPGGMIEPGDDLMFKVELREVDYAPEPRRVDREAWERFGSDWSETRGRVETLEGGIEYVQLAEGPEDGIRPGERDVVVVYYEGRLEDGTVFDSAFERGEAAMFARSRVIPGWQRTLETMVPGDRVLVRIPPDLAYGARGTPGGEIPPNAVLLFEIELMDVLPANTGGMDEAGSGPEE